MGYRGTQTDQIRARQLRAQGWTYNEIVTELGVSRSSVSLWARDVPFDEPAGARPRADRRYGARQRGPNKLAVAKRAEIERLNAEGIARLGQLSDRELLVAGTALYAGEGGKTDGEVAFANSDPRMVSFFCRWLRRFFDVDEDRLRLRLYLHEGLDLAAANLFWAEVTGIPVSQFRKPYRAAADASIRRTKHPMGCATVGYACSATHRRILGLVRALLSCEDFDPG